MRLRRLAVIATLLLPACRSGAGQSTPEVCEPVPGSLAPSARADSLAGQYRLRLVGTTGAARGASAAGTLILAPPDTTARGPAGIADPTHRYPLVGTAELNLAAVEAVAPGGTVSRDPMAPGVLVIERLSGAGDAPGRIILRLGSEANRRDRLRFDGGYTVLRLRHADEQGFAGDWESGAPLPRSGGHFCAVRAVGR